MGRFFYLSEMMKIVVLDGHTLNPGDLSWEGLKQFGNIEVYPRSTPDQVAERSKDADIIVVNKVLVNEQSISSAENLKFVCVSATGYDNIDLSYLQSRKIGMANVAAYSTHSVAQHVMACILSWANQCDPHFAAVREGAWSGQPDFSFTLQTIKSLRNKTIGIVGFGKIGSKIAELALAFDMQVIIYNRSNINPADSRIQQRDLDHLLSNADILSLHIPLNEETYHFIDDAKLRKMKKDAILINTARGGVVDENALYNALASNNLSAAYLDVLSEEPPRNNQGLIQLSNCFITPHLAWSNLEARNRLMEELSLNIAAWLRAERRNRII